MVELRGDRGLASRIRLGRKLKGWTQEELGRQTGLAAAYIGQIEACHHMPGRNALLRIAKALGDTVDYLLRGSSTAAEVGGVSLETLVLELIEKLGPEQLQHLRTLTPKEARELIDKAQLRAFRAAQRKAKEDRKPVPSDPADSR
jgi:transcriptional regulator with XRE-family HTH domain